MNEINDLKHKVRNEQKSNYTIDACLLISICLSVISIQSKNVHAVLGFVFMIVLALHLYLHKRWINYMIVNGIGLSKVSQ